MKCTNCGAELTPGDRFCMRCGARAPEVPAPVVLPERPEAPPPPPPVSQPERPETQPPPPLPPPVFTPPEPKTPTLGKGSGRKWVTIGCLGLLAVACLLAGTYGAWMLGRQSQPPELATAEPTSTPRATATLMPTSTPTATQTPPPPPTSTATPTTEPQLVTAYCSAYDESPVHVPENQPVTIYWGWLALTESQVQDYLDAATVEVSLDGEELRPDTQSQIEYDKDSGGYGIDWLANVGILTPGSHRVDYHVSWSRQISDGSSTYGPGGDFEEQQAYCEIIVGAAPLPSPTPQTTSTTAPTPVPPSPTPTQPPPTPAPPSPTPTRGPVEIDPIVFARGVDADWYPVNPTMTFPSGTTVVYATFTCRGMYQGLEITAIWYHNGQQYWSNTRPWSIADERGNWAFGINHTDGTPLPSGNWRLEFHAEGRLRQSGTFAIQ